MPRRKSVEWVAPVALGHSALERLRGSCERAELASLVQLLRLEADGVSREGRAAELCARLLPRSSVTREGLTEDSPYTASLVGTARLEPFRAAVHRLATNPVPGHSAVLYHGPGPALPHKDIRAQDPRVLVAKGPMLSELLRRHYPQPIGLDDLLAHFAGFSEAELDEAIRRLAKALVMPSTSFDSIILAPEREAIGWGESEALTAELDVFRELVEEQEVVQADTPLKLVVQKAKPVKPGTSEKLAGLRSNEWAELQTDVAEVGRRWSEGLGERWAGPELMRVAAGLRSHKVMGLPLSWHWEARAALQEGDRAALARLLHTATRFVPEGKRLTWDYQRLGYYSRGLVYQLDHHYNLLCSLVDDAQDRLAIHQTFARAEPEPRRNGPRRHRMRMDCALREEDEAAQEICLHWVPPFDAAKRQAQPKKELDFDEGDGRVEGAHQTLAAWAAWKRSLKKEAEARLNRRQSAGSSFNASDAFPGLGLDTSGTETSELQGKEPPEQLALAAGPLLELALDTADGRGLSLTQVAADLMAASGKAPESLADKAVELGESRLGWERVLCGVLREFAGKNLPVAGQWALKALREHGDEDGAAQLLDQVHKTLAPHHPLQVPAALRRLAEAGLTEAEEVAATSEEGAVAEGVVEAMLDFLDYAQCRDSPEAWDALTFALTPLRGPFSGGLRWAWASRRSWWPAFHGGPASARIKRPALEMLRRKLGTEVELTGQRKINYSSGLATRTTEEVDMEI